MLHLLHFLFSNSLLFQELYLLQPGKKTHKNAGNWQVLLFLYHRSRNKSSIYSRRVEADESALSHLLHKKINFLFFRHVGGRLSENQVDCESELLLFQTQGTDYETHQLLRGSKTQSSPRRLRHSSLFTSSAFYHEGSVRASHVHP